MKTRQLVMVALFGALATLWGCDGKGGGNGGGGGASGGTGGSTGGAAGSAAGSGGAMGGAAGSGGGTLKWWTTCGDPVCGMPTDDPNLADCTTSQKEGDPCTMDGASCEI